MKTITFDETKWKLVPIDPTKEMIEAARWKEYGESSSRIRSVSDMAVQDVYSLFLEAAPKYKPETDEDGWIKFDGRPPVSGDVFVDVKFSNGAVVLSEWAEAWDWCKDGGLPYIVAYRISK